MRAAAVFLTLFSEILVSAAIAATTAAATRLVSRAMLLHSRADALRELRRRRRWQIRAAAAAAVAAAAVAEEGSPYLSRAEFISNCLTAGSALRRPKRRPERAADARCAIRRLRVSMQTAADSILIMLVSMDCILTVRPIPAAAAIDVV